MSTTVAVSSPAVATESHSLPSAVEKHFHNLRNIIISSTLFHRAMTAPLLDGISQESMHQLVDEYCKFLILKSHAKDTNAKFISPSGPVDILWNLHLLDTKNYMEACKAAGLFFIHNNPDDARNVEAQQKRFETTSHLYFQVFGCLPPTSYWSNGNVAMDAGLTLEQHAVLGKEKLIVIDCGHVDCECEPKVQHRIEFVVSREQYVNLFWSDHSKEDNTRATKASNAVLDSILFHVDDDASKLLFLDRLGMAKRRREFFLRDRIPPYIDAVQDCPNHCVGMVGSKTICIGIKPLEGKPETLEVLSSFTILHVKVLIRRFVFGNPPVMSQVLLHSGKQLEDVKTLADYGIITSDETTLHLALSAC